MTQNLTTQGDNYNPYADYGAEVGGRIVGDLLKYEKGSYYAGRDQRQIPLGTKLVVNVPGFRRGWMCWKDGKPVDSKMYLLADGQPPGREELGSLDSALWDVDNKGVPKDPWQESSVVIMADVAGKQQYTFSISSKGGRGALQRLVGQFGAEYRQRPGQLPVVTLGTDSYVHANRDFGRINVPVLRIVEWVNDTGQTAEAQGALPLSATVTTLKPRTQDDFNISASQARQNLPDSEIPF